VFSLCVWCRLQGRSLRALPQRRQSDLPRVAVLESEPSPFFAPLLRNFLLGVVSGGLLESFNALSELASLSGSSSNVWSMMAAYPPHFVQDHILAGCLWFAFYVAESAGILASWMEPRASPVVSHQVLASLAAVPKAIIPLKFTMAKALWLRSPFCTGAQDGGEAEHLPAVLQHEAAGEPCSARNAWADGCHYIRAAMFTPEKCLYQSVISSKGVSVLSSKSVVFHAVSAWSPVMVEPPTQQSSARSVPSVRSEGVVSTEQKKARTQEGLKPGEWDPALGDVARKGIAERTLLQDMYYCVAVQPEGGLKQGKLYEATAMGTKVTYWQGVMLPVECAMPWRRCC
jgi:hypothetical protein